MASINKAVHSHSSVRRLRGPLLLWMLMLVIAAGAVAAQAAAEEVPEAECPLLKGMREVQAVTAEFTQTRQIQGLTRPVESSGKFSMEREREIRWETEKPYPSTVTIGSTGFTVDSPAGEGTERLAGHRYEELGKLLLSLHSGDDEEIRRHFVLSCRMLEGVSVVEARPKRAALTRAMRSIKLSGRTRPDVIELVDGRGDLTKIELQYTEAAKP